MLDTEIRDRAGNAPAELVDQMVALHREVMLRQTQPTWWLRCGTARSIGREVAYLMTADDKAAVKALAAQK